MKTKSFTLIELLVVIVIIGILAGVIIVSTSSSIGKANIAKVKVFENSIQNELGANMVSRWKLDGNANDAWGSNNGTCTNCPSYITDDCISGGCANFKNDNTYILLNDSFTVLKNNGTISFWAKKINSTTGAIFARDGYGYYSFLEITSDGNLCGEPDTNNDYFPTYSATANDYNWHNYVLIFGDNYSVLYFDGIKGNIMAEVYDNLTVNSLGAATGIAYSHYFIGFLDDVRIYSSALSTSQIKQEYIAGLNSLLANDISKEEYDQRLNVLAQN